MRFLRKMKALLQYPNSIAAVFLKLTFILDLLFFRILPYVLPFKRYGLLVLTGGELKQCLGLFYSRKYHNMDYFKDKDKIKKMLAADYMISFVLACKYEKKVKFTTNTWITEHVLEPLRTQGILQYEKVAETAEPQPVEKLVLISCRTVYTNVFRKKFWMQILRKEKVITYVIYFFNKEK